MSSVTGLREVSRRAVRSKIAEVARELFASQGFDATTVDEISEAVGMSQRTFFRYFASKEDAALERCEQQSEDFLDRLAGRPTDETEWDSLRRVFDIAVEHHTDSDLHQEATATHRLAQESPTLLAAYLQKADHLQQRLVEELLARPPRNGATIEEPVLRATVGAAFACLQATIAQAADQPHAPDLGTRLDTVMAALRPAHCT